MEDLLVLMLLSVLVVWMAKEALFILVVKYLDETKKQSSDTVQRTQSKKSSEDQNTLH